MEYIKDKLKYIQKKRLKFNINKLSPLNTVVAEFQKIYMEFVNPITISNFKKNKG